VSQDPALRPTSDRVREALFNILGQDFSELLVLDLYAGTGALGFEALSRGARKAVFVEANPRTATILRAAAEELGVGAESRVIVSRVDDILDRERLGGPYDVVFADPPYDADVEGGLVSRIAAAELVARFGTLVVEREGKAAAAIIDGPLELVRTARYGRTALDFFKYR